jgi:hypothetical protein
MASGAPFTKVRHWPWLIRFRSKAKLCSRTPRRASTTTVRSRSPSPDCSAVSVSVGTTRPGPVPNRSQSAAAANWRQPDAPAATASGHRLPPSRTPVPARIAESTHRRAASPPARRRSAVMSGRQSCGDCSARELLGPQHRSSTVNSFDRVCRQNCPQSTRRPPWRRSAYVTGTRAIGPISIYLQFPPMALY